MRAGDDNGLPRDLGVPPDEVYDAADSESTYKPLATKAHPDVPYFNAARLTKTIEEMKNRCQYPVSCSASDMPNGVEWNNFPVCLRTFATIYSALEGHSRSSPEAASVESFVFHNFYDWSTKRKTENPKVKEVVTKKKSFVFFLHKKMVSGRARFVNKIDTCFATFIELFQKNEDENGGTWRVFLMDHGNIILCIMSNFDCKIVTNSDILYRPGRSAIGVLSSFRGRTPELL